jgi:hypothetical protein
MRKGSWVLLAVILVLATASIAAAFPHVINYQGILRDAAGKAVADGPYSVTFRFYDDQAAGNKLWEETQSITTKSGLFNALLGSTIDVPDTVFANDSWLGTVVGTDPEMSPRTRVASVGYAYKARNSDLLQGLGPDELVWPGTPARVFRCFAHLATGASQIFGPAGRTRQITGIWALAPVGVLVRVGGTDVINLRAPGTGPQAFWSSGSGAPIQVGATETIEVIDQGSSSDITITGFEY